MQAAEELRQMMAGETAGGKVDPTMAMFAMMQQQIQRQEERMQQHMQQQMDMLADRLAAGGAAAGGGGHGGAGAGGQGGGGPAAATRSRKMEAPHLKSPEDTTLAVFRDWRERFTEYAAITKLDTECDRRARRGVLREASHPRGLEPAVVYGCIGGRRRPRLERDRGPDERVPQGSEEPPPRSPEFP